MEADIHLYHLVMGRPIGNTFLCSRKKPKDFDDPIYDVMVNPYGQWYEELTYVELMKKFKEHLLFMARNYSSYESNLRIIDSFENYNNREKR